MDLPAETLDGVLLVDKPSGPTSYDIIRWLKRIIKDVRIGHSGTLDPLASGLLIILLGKATKKQSDFMNMEKIYRCQLKLGVRTNTGDVTGTPVERLPVKQMEQAQLREVLESFVGAQSQMPPMFSALKKEGVPLYKLARKGQTVERSPRQIMIHSIEFLGSGEGTIDFRVRCSSGTYVRTLVEDVGSRLGSAATMSALVREGIGSFLLAEAVSGMELRSMTPPMIKARLLQLSAVLH